MASTYTPLLGLVLPVTGELSGTWGAVWNDSGTSLIDAAIAGTTTLSTDLDVTLTTTTGAANTAREAILLCSGARTALRTITAPAQSKIYTIINATTGGYSVKLVGSGPTTGLTIPNGASAVVAWNGSDFIEIGSASVGNFTVNGNLTVTGTSTLTGAITNTAGTANGVAYLNGSKVVTTGSALTFDGTNVFASGTGAGYYLNAAGSYTLGMLASGSDLNFRTGGAPRYKIDSTGISIWEVSGSEQMRLTSTGLGIGTSSPAYKLDVGGTSARLGGGGSYPLYLVADSSGLQLFNASGGATGDGVYLNGASHYLGFYTNSAEKMRLDSSGNLGIGTSSPGQKLDVVGKIRSTVAGGGTHLLMGNSYATVSIGSAQNASLDADLTFYTQTSTERMRLDYNGNLGLGVTPSAWNSGVRMIEFIGAAIGSNNTPAQLYLLSNAYLDSVGWKYKASNYAAKQELVNGAFAWFNAPSGTAGNAITFTQAMTLDASGNLGVGTSSPLCRATVASSNVAYSARGGIYVYTTDSMAVDLGGQITFGGSYTGTSQTIFGSVAARKENSTDSNTSAYLQFCTNNQSTGNAERARIDSSGNLLVGETTAADLAKGFSVNPGTGSCYATIGHASGTATGYSYLIFGYNGSNIGSITQSGTTAVLYNVTSDQRLKENIVDAPEFGSVIDAIQVRSYDWKADHTHQRAGFIAQELVTVAPEAVHQSADPEEMMAVDYSKLVPMLVKEIQSLRKRLADAGIA